MGSQSISGHRLIQALSLEKTRAPMPKGYWVRLRALMKRFGLLS